MVRRPRSHRAFLPELRNELEIRLLLASSPFATIEGSLPADGRGRLITIRIEPSSFQLTDGRALFTFAVRDDDGRAVRIGPIKGQGGRAPSGSLPIATGGRLAALGYGTYTFRVGAGRSNLQDFTVNVGLAGDVDGNFQVTRSDLKAIRANLGRSSVNAPHSAADVNANNRIGTQDLALASRNLRDATSLRPLTVDLAPLQLAPERRLVRIVARSQPGALVTFLQPGIPGAVRAADASGQAAFTALVPVGTTILSAIATDRFGQVVTEIETVQRAALANYLGAAFGPYVKQWNGQPAPNAAVPLFNSYTSGNASVANQIALVAPVFPQIATYGAGYAPYYPTNQPWNMVDSNWQVGPAAAAYNKQQGKPTITVSQGIFQQVQNGSIANAFQEAEVADAFQDASNANATFAGTVTRLVFTNEYVTSAATTDQVNALITANKPKAHDMGLEVGVRSNTFGQLTNPSSPYLPQLQALVKNADFIMCNLYPSQPSEQQGIAASIDDVASQYAAIKAAAVALNPSIEILIGETGWPSQGVSFNDPGGTLNTIANAQAYFNAIRQWANANQVEVMYFEAIDEPWKSNQNNTNPSDPQGFMGAEGHYGVWSYTTDNDSGSFVAKWVIGT
jgi:exo-beta-1,3-glucanase (GH17 family)